MPGDGRTTLCSECDRKIFHAGEVPAGPKRVYWVKVRASVNEKLAEGVFGGSQGKHHQGDSSYAPD